MFFSFGAKKEVTNFLHEIGIRNVGSELAASAPTTGLVLA
jgi:hypothetical protein